MKLKILIGSILVFSATLAKAEGHEPTQMNFNQMIDDNHQDNEGLTKQLAGHYDVQAEQGPKAEVKDEQGVDDFITYEVVHLKKDAVAGDEKPVVKRVYNSVPNS